ncbi:MAG: YceH family protein [Desulfobulbaceae bacterium]|nr:YceH family protein [Desulfobulbaceae bacterium]
MDILLDNAEVRVLGSLMEKSMTTPEYYPLSLNALTNACNQKSNREPVVAFDETTVVRALDGLREKQLVVLSASSRVPKYAEVFVNTRKLVKREAALLMMLLLRGPQTVGELRSRTERVYRFEDLAEVEATLDELSESGYLTKLPRMAGRKESRYAHLLSGEVEAETEAPRPEPATIVVRRENDKILALEEELRQLREDFNALQAAFEKFRQEFE